MKNELQRMFLYFVGAAILLVVLFAAFGPKGKSINLEEISFSTSSSSELYFKNIRAYFYDKEEREDAKFTLFRFGTREKDPHLNKLSFVLVSNWLMSECYIVTDSKFNEIEVHWAFENEKGTIQLEGDNNRQHYTFAAKVFEQLDRKADLEIMTLTGVQAFSEDEKASLRTTLKDYFKLVGKLR